MRVRGVSVAVRALFETPTAAGLAAVAGPTEVVVPEGRVPAGAGRVTPEMVPLAGLTQQELDLVAAGVDGGAGNVADVYPLAPLQEGVFFHHLMAAGSGADVYLGGFVLGFDSRARLDAFLSALQQVVDRHDIYRTAVAWEGLAEPVQVVWRQAQVPVREVTLDPGGDAARQLLAAAGSWMEVARPPLLRACVTAAGEPGRWLALVQIHHLLQDHTAMEVTLEEVGAFLTGRGDQLAAPLPFRNFVAQARLGVAREEHERFFAGLLGDVTEPTAPFGLLDVRGDGTAAAQARLMVTAGLAGRVREQARRAGVSPATLFHLAWARVLAAVSGRDDVVFGTVLFGRMHAGAGADRVPGPFMNTLPVRVAVGAAGAAGAVAAMQQQLAGLLAHEHASLALAQKASGVPARAPLFTSLFNYRHTQPLSTGDGRRSHFEGINLVSNVDHTNYPVAVAVNDAGTQFMITVYAMAPAGPEQVCGLLHTAVENLAGALESAPGTPLRAVGVLGEAERRQLVEGWNDTAVAVAGVTLPELFGVRVAAGPDAVAVVCGDVVVTYGELDVRAGRVAGELAARGAGPESVVAVVMERGVGLVVALLGVLKAGAAYLPVDPGYPADRVGFMLADARPAVVLAGAAEAAEIPARVVVPVVVADERGVAGGLAAGGGGAGCWRPGGGVAGGASGVRDLHVGVDGAAQGGGGLACGVREPGGGSCPAAGGGCRGPGGAVRVGEL